MIDSNTAIIYYQPGAYGTFVEWCLNYFSDLNFGEELPFTETGSSHNFKGNSCSSIFQFEQIINDPVPLKFLRSHPGNIQKSFSYYEDLKILSSFSKNVIVLYIGEQSHLWGLNNRFEKIAASVTDDKAKMHEFWDENKIKVPVSFFKSTLRDRVIASLASTNNNITDSITDDLLILYLADCLKNKSWGGLLSNSDITYLKDSFPNLCFVEIGELRDSFSITVQKIIEFVNLTLVRDDRFDYVYENWIKLQYHCFKDTIIKTTNNHNLTIIDKAYKCYLGL